ncbi:FkbM family methyltransferase [Bradyrhizobium elkanii]|uniref:FkbM family methyltransferase n=1 Tax=Bradyrhizobium elkanii TaxID=29448 RepID=UPI003D236396
MWVRDEDGFMPQYFDATGDRFQVDHLEVALSFCQRRNTAIDVGAHYGSWSRYLAQQFQTVWAFEPVLATFECLLENTREFSNINVIQSAVGDLGRRVRIGVGKMYHHPGMETVISCDSGDIDMVKIDDLNIVGMDFLKIDVEGFELQVLLGAKATVLRDRPVILFEENVRGPLEHGVPNGTCRNLLESWGARLLSIQGEDFIFGWP